MCNILQEFKNGKYLEYKREFKIFDNHQIKKLKQLKQTKEYIEYFNITTLTTFIMKQSTIILALLAITTSVATAARLRSHLTTETGADPLKYLDGDVVYI